MKTKYTIYCVLMTLAALSAPISAEYDIAGDVNADGRITTADSLLALRLAVGSVAPDPGRADVNADGRVGSLDALTILVMAEKTQVCVNTPEVASGTFDVTIDIYNAADLDSGQFDLTFDSSVVNVTAVHDGNIAGTTVPIVYWRLLGDGTIRVLFNLPGVVGVSGQGQIATISFEVTGSQGDASVLDISGGELVDTGAEKMPAIWIDNKVAIGGYPPADHVCNVNTGETFCFIQDAIDDLDTLDGHILEVEDGVFRENLQINKSLTVRSLNGSANCVVQGVGNCHVVRIIADCVDISGFTVMRSPESTLGGAGIHLSASYCNVSSNNCSNNEYGICLDNSCGNIISSNTCSNNRYGIHIDDSSNNSIAANNCSNNRDDGIFISGSSNNKLTGNIMFEGGIFIGGDSLSDYTQGIDETNTVN